MAGITVVRGEQPVEYVEEATFATAETDPTMSWIGLVTSFSSTIETIAETISHLPDDADSGDLQSVRNQKVSEAFSIDLTYHPQDFTFLQYINGAVGDTSANTGSIQFGEQDTDNGEFHQYLGAVGEEYTLTIEEDSVAEVSSSFMAAADVPWSGTDYVGTGSHATENTADALTYDDLSNVQWGGASIDDAIESLELSVSNDLAVVKDPNSSLDSHIDAIVPVNREITVDLGLTYTSFNMVSDIRSLTSQDLTFDFGPSSESWTVSNVSFPEFPYEFGPEDLVADSVSSLPADGLTFA